MHLACVNRQSEVVDILLSAGAMTDIVENVTNLPYLCFIPSLHDLMQDGLTSLMLVASQEDSTDIAAALIEAKADPNIQDRVRILVVTLVVP